MKNKLLFLVFFFTAFTTFSQNVFVHLNKCKNVSLGSTQTSIGLSIPIEDIDSLTFNEIDDKKVALLNEIDSLKSTLDLLKIQVSDIKARYDSINTIINNPVTELKSTVDEKWSGWNEQRLTFGIDKTTVPIPIVNKTQLINYGTVIAGGSHRNLMRWGFHVFEGYAADNKSRITMLVNKHTEEDKALAELYYYLTAYNHSDRAYGWFKLGSDVRQHSFMFSRDKSLFWGSLDLRNVMTLARINPSTDLIGVTDMKTADSKYEPDTDYLNNSKCVTYLALKNAENGTMFYDTKRNAIVVKVNGIWCEMNVIPIINEEYKF